MTNKILTTFLLIAIASLTNACDKVEATKPSDNIVTSPDLKSKKGYIMPNTNWETRSINGITYVFGEGNPQEVALNPSEYTGEGKWADYVTPESETLLKEFLTDGTLKTFVDQCAEPLGITNAKTMSGMPEFNITKTEDLDINKILLVDKETGRKKFDDRIFVISQLLWSINTHPKGQIAVTACMDDKEIMALEKLRATLNSMTASYINHEGNY